MYLNVFNPFWNYFSHTVYWRGGLFPNVYSCLLCGRFVILVQSLSRVMGFPGGSDSKEFACNVGNLASILGLGRSPGGGHGYPHQYSCLENPHGQRSLVGYSSWCHRVRQDWATKHSPTLCDPMNCSLPGSSVFHYLPEFAQILVLEKTLENPLDCKEIKPDNLKGNQPWILIERTDATAEAPIIWPPDAKSRLTGKDPDAGKDWNRRKRGWQKMRRWDGWMASPIQWTWIWANSGNWWRTGKPGMLQSMGVAKSRTWLSKWTTTTYINTWCQIHTHTHTHVYNIHIKSILSI